MPRPVFATSRSSRPHQCTAEAAADDFLTLIGESDHRWFNYPVAGRVAADLIPAIEKWRVQQPESLQVWRIHVFPLGGAQGVRTAVIITRIHWQFIFRAQVEYTGNVRISDGKDAGTATLVWLTNGSMIFAKARRRFSFSGQGR